MRWSHTKSLGEISGSLWPVRRARASSRRRRHCTRPLVLQQLEAKIAFSVTPTPYPDWAEANDTLETATNLSIVVGSQSYSELTIHTADDRDFFRFETTGAGTEEHFVKVHFSNDDGDLDAQLLDASGNVLVASTGTTDDETLSLAGLPAGTYYVEVHGFAEATNFYGLEFNASDALYGDWAEANDTLETAFYLGTIEGSQSFSGLTIHTADDRDFFRFETTGEGTEENYVKVLFAHDYGDLDAQLLDASGNVLVASTGVTDDETLSLAGLPAGTYYVEVHGFAGAINFYGLEFNTFAVPYGDWAEANDTLETATDLRTIEGSQSFGGLTIHTADDRDFFRFETTGEGTEENYVKVLFAHDYGDLDAQLLDASGNVLVASAGVTDDETLSLAGLPAGTYYVEVHGFAGAINFYGLEFNTPSVVTGDRLEANDTLQSATELRTVSGSLSLEDLSIHNASDRDFFRFAIGAAATATHAIQISFVQARGDLNLRLFDAQGNELRSSLGTVDNERISLAGLAAGSYVVEVFGATPSDTNTYRLDFATPVVQQPGGGAADAWTIMVYITASDLDRFAFDDVNELEKAVSRLPGTVNLSVFWDQSSSRTTYVTGGGTQPAWGTAGRAFIVSDTNMTSVATPFEVLAEANTGNPQTLVDFVNWSVANAPAQRYGLVLWDHGAGLEGFNFDNSDSGQQADNLTTPELVQALTTLRTAGTTIDLLAFDACLMAMTEVGYATRDLTTAFVASQEVVGGEGHDYTTLFRTLESNPYAVTAQVLASGFVDSFGAQYLGTGTSDTQSAVLSPRYGAIVSALSSFTQAAAGATATERTAMSTARNATPSYTYAYLRDLGGFMQRIAGNALISQTIRTAAAAVVNAVSDAVSSKTSDSRGSSGMSIYLPALGSSIATWYASQYAAFDAATGWSGFLSGTTAVGRNALADWTGSRNSVAARAYDLGVVAGSGFTFDKLSLEEAGGVDWFRFTMHQSGGASNRVLAVPVGTSGILGVQLYNMNGTTRLREVADGSSGLSLDGLAPGQYALRIQAVSPVERYALTFDAPTLAANFVVPNVTPEKAVQWGIVTSVRLFTGVAPAPATSSQGAATRWCYFDFTTAPLVDRQILTFTVNTTADVSLDVEVLDESGAVVASNTASGSVSVTFAPTASRSQYSLRVRQTQSAGPQRSLASPAAFSVLFDQQIRSNSSPTDVQLVPTSIAEKNPINAVVGTFTTTDPDAGDTSFTYALVAGEGSADNALFTIAGNQLRAAAAFDYEARTTFSIRVRTTDSGSLSFDKAFTISVTDVNDLAPVFTSAATGTVAENAPVATAIYTAATTDADGTVANRAVTYAIKPGVGDADSVEINATTGVVTLKAGANYETKASYAFTVVATNAGTGATLTTELPVTVSVTNANETPSDITLSTMSVAENSAVGTVLGSFTPSDPDAGDTFTYALVSGSGDTDNAAFTIVGRDLQIASKLNFEAKQTYSVRVRVTDAGGLAMEKAFSITVTDIADEPLLVERVTPPASAAYGAGRRVQFTVTLSEVVQVTGKPEIEVRAGTATRKATYVSGSGTAVLTFEYTVNAKDSAAAVAIGQKFLFPKKSAVAAGTEKLTAALPAGIAGATAPGVRFDAVAPRTSGKVIVPGAGTYTVGRSLDFVVRFSEAVIVGGTPQISLTGFSGTRTATYVSGSGTMELTFRYLVQTGDAVRGKKGLGLAKSIALAGGASITDEAGNRADLKIVASPMKGIRIDAVTAASTLAREDVTPSKRTARAAAFASL